jgi:hypothetical protein
MRGLQPASPTVSASHAAALKPLLVTRRAIVGSRFVAVTSLSKLRPAPRRARATLHKGPIVATQARTLARHTQAERKQIRASVAGSFQLQATKGEETFLEANAVQPPTYEDYRARCNFMISWFSTLALPLSTVAQIEAAITDFLNMIW